MAEGLIGGVIGDEAPALAPRGVSGTVVTGALLDELTRLKDPTRAAAKLLEANRRGPHWADPLKAWGDVLMKQAHIKEALKKYDEALKYAPTWEALKETRAAAAKKVPT
jgi:tetratricopeptide (TPR) repeat protein